MCTIRIHPHQMALQQSQDFTRSSSDEHNTQVNVLIFSHFQAQCYYACWNEDPLAYFYFFTCLCSICTHKSFSWCRVWKSLKQKILKKQPLLAFSNCHKYFMKEAAFFLMRIFPVVSYQPQCTRITHVNFSFNRAAQNPPDSSHLPCL